ncbi:MAG: diguanylate phosphodiesterase [Desulfuromonas sp.]|nr:MAG: diguanylate phosphodiesterase [Desulfuromonas sp.]
MPEMEDDKGGPKKVEEFLHLFKKGAEFTQDLLKENERLRFQLLEIESKCKDGDGSGGDEASEVAKLQKRIDQMEQEKEEILGRIKQIEEENIDFANRYVDIENENNMLANLYIASYQLHSTLDFKEVLQIITEIVINLIGAEEFAIQLLDEKVNKLTAVATEGITVEEVPKIALGEGIIGQMAKTGENYFAEDLENYQKDMLHPMVCISLKIKEHVIGVISIYKLLEQKERFADVDYELFTLLAGHAATAIFSSKLYSESERKLNTIQGFIDLMTK